MQNVTNGPTPEFLCDTCQDYGSLEVCHPSTDALLYWVKCDYCPTLSKGVYAKPLDWRNPIWKKTPEELAREADCPF
jgi:hypothetical protein